MPLSLKTRSTVELDAGTLNAHSAGMNSFSSAVLLCCQIQLGSHHH